MVTRCRISNFWKILTQLGKNLSSETLLTSNSQQRKLNSLKSSKGCADQPSWLSPEHTDGNTLKIQISATTNKLPNPVNLKSHQNSQIWNCNRHKLQTTSPTLVRKWRVVVTRTLELKEIYSSTIRHLIVLFQIFPPAPPAEASSQHWLTWVTKWTTKRARRLSTTSRCRLGVTKAQSTERSSLLLLWINYLKLVGRNLILAIRSWSHKVRNPQIKHLQAWRSGRPKLKCDCILVRKGRQNWSRNKSRSKVSKLLA